MKLATVDHRETILNFSYWQKVDEIRATKGWTVAKARRELHKQSKFPPPKNKAGHDRQAKEMIAKFMQPLVPRGGLTEAMYRQVMKQNEEQEQTRGRMDSHLNAHGATLEKILSKSSYLDRMDLPPLLNARKEKDLLIKLSKDPAYGPEAGWELGLLKWSENFADEERRRKNALPPPLKKLSDIADNIKWGISVHYPYSHPAKPDLPEHTFCVLGDGFPMFRFEVLDPGSYTQFRLIEICKGSDHWFDFSALTNHRNIFTPTGADTDYEGLLKIMESSLERSNKRP